jgi:hypothetical protein
MLIESTYEKLFRIAYSSQQKPNTKNHTLELKETSKTGGYNIFVWQRSLTYSF